MRLVIEDTDNQIHDVTNMFDAQGNTTEDKEQAVVIVFKVGDGFVSTELPSPEAVHTVH